MSSSNWVETSSTQTIRSFLRRMPRLEYTLSGAMLPDHGRCARARFLGSLYPLSSDLGNAVDIPWVWIGAFMLISLRLVMVFQSLTGHAEEKHGLLLAV